MNEVNTDALAEAYWAWNDPEFWDDEEQEDSDINEEQEDE